MIERRRIARGRSYLGGTMIFNHSYSTMDCLVRNISTAGARLEFTNSVTVPGEFELLIKQEGYSRVARMIWRDQNAVGVAFMDKLASIIPLNTDAARRLRAAENRNAALMRRIEDLTYRG